MANYFAEPLPDNPKQVDIDGWWMDRKGRYPLLADLAFDITAAPASSAVIERGFSQASTTCTVKRNRIGADYLNAEVTIKINKWLITENE
jgi:hypothetical protein